MAQLDMSNPRVRQHLSAVAFANRIKEQLGDAPRPADRVTACAALHREAKRRKQWELDGSEYLYEQANAIQNAQ